MEDDSSSTTNESRVTDKTLHSIAFEAALSNHPVNLAAAAELAFAIENPFSKTVVARSNATIAANVVA